MGLVRSEVLRLGRVAGRRLGIVFGEQELGIGGPIRYHDLEGTNSFYVKGEEQL